ncbi:MAG TPA: SDR family oxidoreductase [Candidatus Sulfotelmatobacter sp.]|jgi:NAD(P)-dependent dehydrogenase (short-subunit alcohol dehydrogenase family)|nr:SDR family oxidoreductase [Candidatus Sulfotelmatobacter sp.]
MKTNNKVALITGANRGLGLQTARELGKPGITLLLGVRDVSKSQEALKELRGLGHAVEAIPLDVSDIQGHNHVYDLINEKYGKLDILVNNAGIWKETLTSSSNIPGSNNTSTVRLELLREIFETNFFGTVNLTQRLLPLIRKSPAGRIVNVSSIMGSLTLHSDPASPIYQHKVFAYDTSKTALNSFTVHLAHELRDTPIKVNSAHPGWVRTEMGGEGANLDVSEGGKTSAMLATLPDDGPTGGYFHLGQKLPW